MTQPVYNYGQGPPQYGAWGPPQPGNTNPDPNAGPSGPNTPQGTNPSYQYTRASNGNEGGPWGGLAPLGPGGYYTRNAPYTTADPRFAYGGMDYGQQYYQNLYEGLASQYGSRQAPQADYGASGASQDYANYLSGRGDQQGLAAMLMPTAQGQGTTGADYAFQQGTDKNIAAQMAMANSARGGATSLAAAQRGAAQQGVQTQAASAAQLGQQKFAEQTAAQQQLAGLYNQMQQQALASRGMGQQQAQFGVTAGMNQEQLNQQGQLAALAQEQGVNQAQLQAYMNQADAAQQWNMMRYGTQNEWQQALAGGGAGAAGGLMMAL